MTSTVVSTTSDTPVKMLVSFDKDGHIQVLDPEVLDLIAGGFFGDFFGGLNGLGGNIFDNCPVIITINPPPPPPPPKPKHFW